MENDWETLSLGDCAEFMSGGTPSKSNASYWIGSTPWISAKDMKSFRLYDAEDHISDSACDDGARLAPNGSILILVRGMTLHNDVPVCVIRQKMAFNQDIKALVVKPNINISFLSYWLVANKPYLLTLVDSASHGTGRIHTDILRGIELRLPPNEVQQKIASFFERIDDKIELNRKTNETLEAMAKALFKSWFVDFDPVREKAAGRTPQGLDPEIAKLFPDSFEDSPLGPIPKGWRVTKLVEHTTATKGLSYKGSGLSAVGLPMHNLNSIYEGGGYKYEGIKFYVGEYRERHVIKAGELIVANTEQGHDRLLLGYAAIIPESLGSNGLFSHHTYHLKVRQTSYLTPDYLLKLLNSSRMHDLVSGFGNGTTVNMLPIDGIEQPEIVLPPKSIVEFYSELAKNIRKKQDQTHQENINLASTRDDLLPKLMSGELSVA